MDAKLELLLSKLKSLEKRNSTIKKREKKLSQQITELKKQAEEINEHHQIIKQYLDLVRSISKDVLVAREKVLLLKNKSGGADIAEEAEREIENTIAYIQSICSHQFVLSYKTFRGYACENYYDGYSGRRMCVICGMEESPYNTYKEDLYRTMIEFPNRMFAWHEGFRPQNHYRNRDGEISIRYTHDVELLNIWQPLEQLLNIFEEDNRNNKIGEVLKKC